MCLVMPGSAETLGLVYKPGFCLEEKKFFFGGGGCLKMSMEYNAQSAKILQRVPISYQNALLSFGSNNKTDL